jgi:hypothetical protein
VLRRRSVLGQPGGLRARALHDFANFRLGRVERSNEALVEAPVPRDVARVLWVRPELRRAKCLTLETGGRVVLHKNRGLSYSKFSKLS